MSSFKYIVATAASLTLLAGCTDPAYLTGGENQNAGRGAAIGAASGAVIGNLVAGPGNRTGGALLGAAAGAIVGGAIGADLDRQAAELNQDFTNSEIDVINTGSELIVRMPQDILFAVDSDQVNSGLRADLFVLANSLNQYPQSRVTITGHTDNTGSAAYNQDLSERRAVEVSAILIQGGVNGTRLNAVGAGEDQPLASNLTEEGRAQNRRVDIRIQPTEA
ncbi:MAG: OmpA family protein [Rhodobacteraceae bacterium]|nr:OmpA family protein [Paracoccaceae bacterium]